MLQRMTTQFDFQAEALQLRAERQRLIASNIANADTPGYQARDFDFAQALRDATQQLRSPGSGGADVLGSPIARGVGAGGTAAPRLSYALAAQPSLDRNTVDMDRERASFADNALRYEASLRFLNGSLRTLTEAMRNHNGS
ncbi:MAG: flagellar basal body rod protein FlgB [Burkholderiales bacterium]|nr:flagellar basal body rod protein FlgB [Burkholderiales bacterium]